MSEGCVLERAQGRMAIRLQAVVLGDDLCVLITGGDRSHIGAVALSLPRASLSDPARISASTSVLTVMGHKEDELAREVGQALASQLNRKIVVCCGIHVDHATSEEIAFVGEAVRSLVRDLVAGSEGHFPIY